MVSCIIGLPGSGKSTLLSYLGNRAISGKTLNFRGFHVQTTDYDHVFSNFPLDGAFQLDFDSLGICEYKDSCILCDEIQLFADSRNFKSFTDRLSFWFTNHRKFRTDFIYCTQDFGFVDKRIRGITDRIYVVDMLPFRIIRCRQVLTTFEWKGLTQAYSPSSGLNVKYFYAPRLYKYNDTYAMCKKYDFEPTPLIPWSDSVNSSGHIINTEKTVIINSNGSIT